MIIYFRLLFLLQSYISQMHVVSSRSNFKLVDLHQLLMEKGEKNDLVTFSLNFSKSITASKVIGWKTIKVPDLTFGFRSSLKK